ncbi:MAG: dihydroorotate dehydrogenase-like protein [Anaerolineae bacterium]
MADISTKYLGLTLKNPLVVGSSGLTDTPEKVQELEKKGAGAVVLKSIFEEEIEHTYRDILREEMDTSGNMEALDYFDYQIRAETLDRFRNLVEESKEKVSIPVIASVNCSYSHEWVYFAQELESAGADALELNMFFLPSDLDRTREEREAAYFAIIDRVEEEISVPVSLKISHYFTDLGPMIKRLSETGIEGLVLFNRFWQPDFDIENLEIVPSRVLSTPDEISLPLRWIAIMAGRVDCDLAASTGVHDAEGLIKALLAGAQVAQAVSTFYMNGTDHIQVILDGLEDWMEEHEYLNLDHLRGLMSQAASADPAAYERVQFMRYFGQRFGPPGEGRPQALDEFTY